MLSRGGRFFTGWYLWAHDLLDRATHRIIQREQLWELLYALPFTRINEGYFKLAQWVSCHATTHLPTKHPRVVEAFRSYVSAKYLLKAQKIKSLNVEADNDTIAWHLWILDASEQVLGKTHQTTRSASSRLRQVTLSGLRDGWISRAKCSLTIDVLFQAVDTLRKTLGFDHYLTLEVVSIINHAVHNCKEFTTISSETELASMILAQFDGLGGDAEAVDKLSSSWWTDANHHYVVSILYHALARSGRTDDSLALLDDISHKQPPIDGAMVFEEVLEGYFMSSQPPFATSPQSHGATSKLDNLAGQAWERLFEEIKISGQVSAKRTLGHSWNVYDLLPLRNGPF